MYSFDNAVFEWSIKLYTTLFSYRLKMVSMRAFLQWDFCLTNNLHWTACVCWFNTSSTDYITHRILSLLRILSKRYFTRLFRSRSTRFGSERPGAQASACLLRGIIASRASELVTAYKSALIRSALTASHPFGTKRVSFVSIRFFPYLQTWKVRTTMHCIHTRQ